MTSVVDWRAFRATATVVLLAPPHTARARTTPRNPTCRWASRERVGSATLLPPCPVRVFLAPLAPKDFVLRSSSLFRTRLPC
jgi:hypothetical protein